MMGEFAFDLKIASESALRSCCQRPGVGACFHRNASRRLGTTDLLSNLVTTIILRQLTSKVFSNFFEKFNTLLPFSMQIDTPTGPRLNGGYIKVSRDCKTNV